MCWLDLWMWGFCYYIKWNKISATDDCALTKQRFNRGFEKFIWSVHIQISVTLNSSKDLPVPPPQKLTGTAGTDRAAWLWSSRAAARASTSGSRDLAGSPLASVSADASSQLPSLWPGQSERQAQCLGSAVCSLMGPLRDRRAEEDRGR